MNVIEICELACFSDHLPVLFTVSVPCSRSTDCASRRLRSISPQTALQFSALYNDFAFPGDTRVALGINPSVNLTNFYIISTVFARMSWTLLHLSE